MMAKNDKKHTIYTIFDGIFIYESHKKTIVCVQIHSLKG